MNERPVTEWIQVSQMLREAMEQYRDNEKKKSLSAVYDDVIAYLYDESGKWLDKKTIRRDIGNKTGKEKLYRIPNWRVEIYAQWLHEYVEKDREWISRWLKNTEYPTPGKLLAELHAPEKNIHKVYKTVKSNVPPLKSRLWGRFLGRQAEMERLIQWADNQRHPIAVLCGFGGNGKTTIQLKVGEEFVHGVKCQLRWPYDGAVWVSANDYHRGQPGLLDVLRKIAATFELFDKEINLELIQGDVIKTQVKEVLQEKRILVLLDNFETVSKANQSEILEFFNNLPGSSQTLISTRYRPDWYLEQQQDIMFSMAHVMIPVEGLSLEDVETLTRNFLTAKALDQNRIGKIDTQRLTEVTHHNPKSILAVLGLVEQGMSLSYLLDAITAGSPEADNIFDLVIDKAWEEILTESDKAVLMAKAFFRHSVSDFDLGQVAGVTAEQLRTAIKKLAAISFFELERTKLQELRISTHPLAQDFAHRILRDYSQFEAEAEERWWKEYASKITQKAGQTAYELIRPELEDDVSNVIERMEKHFFARSRYRLQAAEKLGAYRGLGQALRHWGKWDEALKLGELTLKFGIEQRDPQLIGQCALYLISALYSTTLRL